MGRSAAFAVAAALRIQSGKLLSSPSSFGFVCATVVAFVVFAMILGNAPVPSTGIYVSVKAPQPEPRDAPFLMEPIVVRIESNGEAHLVPNIFVNSKPVPWNDLKQALRDQLKLRPQWVVYVEGDVDLSWQYLAEAASIARDLHARVVLLTPETQKILEVQPEKRKSRRRAETNSPR